MKTVTRALQFDSAMVSELNRERASGLGRTGRLLEEAIATCAALAAELARPLDERRRAELVSQYETHRKTAIEQRWYLEVQREAMGLRRHTDLDTYFPLPPALTK